jgi:hypothetical protein
MVPSRLTLVTDSDVTNAAHVLGLIARGSLSYFLVGSVWIGFTTDLDADIAWSHLTLAKNSCVHKMRHVCCCVSLIFVIPVFTAILAELRTATHASLIGSFDILHVFFNQAAAATSAPIASGAHLVR